MSQSLASSFRHSLRWSFTSVSLALLLVGRVEAADGVVHVVTDKGTIDIRTEDEDVKIIAERKGKQITIHDPRSKQSWIMDTAAWTVRTVESTEGLAVEMPATFTLKRGDKTVVTLKRDKEAGIATKPEEVRRIVWETNRLFYVRISPDSRYYLGTGDPDKTRVWDMATGKQLYELDGYVAHFTPDGNHIVAGSWANSTFRVYEVATGKKLREFAAGGDLWNFFLSPCGKRICAGIDQGGLRWSILDLEAGKELHRVTNLESQFFSSDGRYYYWREKDMNPRGLDLESGKEVKDLPPRVEEYNYVYYLPGGKQMVYWNVKEKAVSVREIATGKDLHTFELGEDLNGSLNIAVSADGRRLLSAHTDGTVRVWDVKTGKVQHRITVEGSFAGHALHLSADGRYATAGVHGGRVYLWRLP